MKEGGGERREGEGGEGEGLSPQTEILAMALLTTDGPNPQRFPKGNLSGPDDGRPY